MAKASTKAKNKYAAKAYDRITLLVPKGSVNGYVNQAINERLQKDGFPVMQRQEQEGAGEP